MVAVTSLHRRGYFDQRLDARGEQSEEPVTWPAEGLLKPVEPPVEIDLEGRIRSQTACTP
jgi:starch phosphorylase